MKRTYDVNIGGTLFQVEEDAYVRLKKYLESVWTHFASYQDNADIVADIEGRIAEQCVQRHSSSSSGSRLVTLSDVEHVIDTMGSVDQFDDPALPEPGARKGTTVAVARAAGGDKRRLLRDPDDIIIAGVASGVARYWGVAPRSVRIVLLISLIATLMLVILASGWVVPEEWAILSFLITIVATAIYLLLWLLVPLAKTTTDKLRMRGDPVTLTSVEQQVRIEETATTPGARTPAATLVMGIGAAIRTLVLGAVWAGGFVVAAGAAIATVGLTAFLMMVLSNPSISPATKELLPYLGLAYYPFVVCSYLLTVIPFVLIGMIVVVEVRKRRDSRWNRPALGVYLTTMIVWMVVLMVWAWLWAGYIGRRSRNPEFSNVRIEFHHDSPGSPSIFSASVSRHLS